MTKGEKYFNTIITVVVMLTGAGFGAFTGFVYSELDYWWVGLTAGAVVAFPLAKLYLWQLTKPSGKIATWFYGTFIAIVCGLICTSILHGIMTVVVYSEDIFSDTVGPFSSEIGNLWPIVAIVGEIIGASAGFILGGICSLVYVLTIKGRRK